MLDPVPSHVGEVLVERATAADAEDLPAAADGQDRQVPGICGPRKVQLKPVEVLPARSGQFMAAGAIGNRVEIRAAREADAVDVA